MTVILEAQNLVKRYPVGDGQVDALRGVSLAVERGEFVAIMGASGSGKSTLLHLLGGLDKPTAGQVVIDGVNISTLDDEQATLTRRDKTGFVFQFFNLIPLLTEGLARWVCTREELHRALEDLLGGRDGPLRAAQERFREAHANIPGVESAAEVIADLASR